MNDRGLVEASIEIAKKRETQTRDLARAVMDGDYDTAERIARELIPNEAHRRAVEKHRRKVAPGDRRNRKSRT